MCVKLTDLLSVPAGWTGQIKLLSPAGKSHRRPENSSDRFTNLGQTMCDLGNGLLRLPSERLSRMFTLGPCHHTAEELHVSHHC